MQARRRPGIAQARRRPTRPALQGRGGSGFTLMELLLALVILTILVGMAWPQLRQPLKRYQIRRAGEELRVAWSKTRVQAMTSGMVYAFRHQENGRAYTIEAWAEIDPQEEVTGALAVGTAQIAGALENLEGEVSEELTEPIEFVSTIKEDTARDLSFEPDERVSAQLDEWSSPILFYPDGTTSTATVTVAGEDEQYVTVKIEGLTGITSLIEHNSLEEATQ